MTYRRGNKDFAGKDMGENGASKIEKAEECILRGIKILDELKIKPWPTQGYLFLGKPHTDTGQIEIALENLKKAEWMFREMGMDYWLGKAQEVLAAL